MKRILFSLMAGVVSVASCDAAEPTQEPHFRNVAFTEVLRLAAPASAEGRLSAEQWEVIPSAEDFYVYWDSDPALSPLRSAVQMTYDDTALYMRVTAREEQMDKVRKAIIKRGDPTLWTDDCFEIYIDPRASGISYVVFTINSLGIQNDRKQMDAAVSIKEWRGEGWRTWASAENDRWVVEMTFPFSDLEATPKEGDVWMFNLVRYAYTSGKFQGASWAPGGTYSTPGNFGYLYFGGEKPAGIEDVARKLLGRVIAPWSVVSQGRMIRSKGGDDLQMLATTEAAARMRERYQALGEVLLDLSPAGSEDNERVTKLMADGANLSTSGETESLNAIRSLRPLYAELYALYWKQRINTLAEQNSKRP